jgi:hypothetical protein
MRHSTQANVLRPAFPTQQELAKGSLLVKNEGTRALQIICDAMADGEKVLPGCSLEIDMARFEGPVQLTFYEGGIQLGTAVESACPVSGNVESAAPPGTIA